MRSKESLKEGGQIVTKGLSSLSEKTRRVLAFEGITSRAQLASTVKSSLMRMPGIGPNRLREIETFLSGASEPNWETVDRVVLDIIRDYVDQAHAVKCASRIVIRLQHASLRRLGAPLPVLNFLST
jgi:hypothetical protein